MINKLCCKSVVGCIWYLIRSWIWSPGKNRFWVQLVVVFHLWLNLLDLNGLHVSPQHTQSCTECLKYKLTFMNAITLRGENWRNNVLQLLNLRVFSGCWNEKNFINQVGTLVSAETIRFSSQVFFYGAFLKVPVKLHGCTTACGLFLFLLNNLVCCLTFFDAL